MKLAICMPTRGMIMTETVNGIFENIKEVIGPDDGYAFSFTQALPIPDAHNASVEQALSDEDKPTHILLLEEDVVMPPGILKEMLDKDAPVVVADYPQAFGESTVARKGGKVWMAGTGCVLLKAEVFEKLPKPYFDVNKSFSLRQNDAGEWEPVFKEAQHTYAGQDAYFFSLILEAGYEIVETETVCGHMKAKRLNMTSNNKGYHDLEKYDEITQPIMEGFEMADGKTHEDSVEADKEA